MAPTRRLSFTPPLEFEALLTYFGRRAVASVEEVDGNAYRRSLRLPGGSGVIELHRAGDGIAARLWLEDPGDEDAALAYARRLLDLDADPATIAATLGRDALMAPLVSAAPGRRVPGAADGFELALRAVLGQQISVARAGALAGSFVAEYGEVLSTPVGTITRVFPDAAAIAAADDSAWPMPRARAGAIKALASAVADGALVLEPGVDQTAARERLLALPGIGPWTAEYIAMRALGDRDAFLASDLGVKHALRRLGLDPRPAAAEAVAERWRPFRSYALQHLWTVTS